MAKFRVSVVRSVYLEAEIDADTEADARDRAQQGDADSDWTESGPGRGLGDDDYEVLAVEEIDDDDDEPYCDFCQTDGHDVLDCPNIDPEQLEIERARRDHADQ